MSKFFSLIAYKPNSDDFCRGCLMASYSSEFECLSNISQAELVDNLSDFMVKNASKRCGEADFKFTVFNDSGIKVYDNDYPIYDEQNRYTGEETDSIYDEMLAREKVSNSIITDIFGQANFLAIDKKKVIDDQKALDEKSKLENRKKDREAQERRQYEELSLKFGKS